MKSHSRLLRFLRSLACGALLVVAGVSQAADSAPVVTLKLDDLVRQGNQPNATVSPRWQRTADFLE